MRAFTSLTGTIFDETNKEYKNIVKEILNFKVYEKYFKIYIIKPQDQYRPDKICLKLFNNQDASWILDEINNFSGNVDEYYLGREIFYLPQAQLTSLGLL